MNNEFLMTPLEFMKLANKEQLAEMKEYSRKGLYVSPLGEYVGYGDQRELVISIGVMTAEEVIDYYNSGGTWEYEPAANYLMED
jgi:hypothetical protein